MSNKLIGFFFILLTISLNCCSVNKKNAKGAKVEKGKDSINCEMIAPDYTGDVAASEIKEQVLLPHLQEQQKLLKELSASSEIGLDPDGKNLIGRFDCGVIELEIKQIDGDPNYVYGLVDDVDIEFEFLIYGISPEKLDKIELGDKYRIHWMETICFMEPYEHGYQRTHIAYNITKS